MRYGGSSGYSRPPILPAVEPDCKGPKQTFAISGWTPAHKKRPASGGKPRRPSDGETATGGKLPFRQIASSAANLIKPAGGRLSTIRHSLLLLWYKSTPRAKLIKAIPKHLVASSLNRGIFPNNGRPWHFGFWSSPAGRLRRVCNTFRRRLYLLLPPRQQRELAY